VDETVRRFSDGLPFLVEELLGAGSLTFGDVSASESVTVPARFADLVQSRLAQLPDDAASVLVEAAVLGSRFLADVLPIVTGKPAATTTDALRRGIEAQLVRADPDHPARFGFRHAQVAGDVADLFDGGRSGVASPWRGQLLGVVEQVSCSSTRGRGCEKG
jgi:hypothetical protein